MGDAIVLELLRCRSLLMHVITVACAKRLVDFLDIPGIDAVDLRVIHTHLMYGVLQHGQRLSRVVDQYLPCNQLVPLEVRIRFARRDKKPVPLVDLGEVDEVIRSPSLERIPAVGNR